MWRKNDHSAAEPGPQTRCSPHVQLGILQCVRHADVMWTSTLKLLSFFSRHNFLSGASTWAKVHRRALCRDCSRGYQGQVRDIVWPSYPGLPWGLLLIYMPETRHLRGFQEAFCSGSFQWLSSDPEWASGCCSLRVRPDTHWRKLIPTACLQYQSVWTHSPTEGVYMCSYSFSLYQQIVVTVEDRNVDWPVSWPGQQ